jgi:glycosyltransferase involved in cell wall biosynthesis
MKPKVTVITVTLNAARDLRKTMESVTGQDYPRLEIIVIDGGSSDGTHEVIMEFAERIDHWISEPDRGIYDAMNKGLKMATGEWVNFMNAGDIFFDSHGISGIFDRNGDEADVLYGDSIAHYPGFMVMRKALQPGNLWKGMICCHQSMFVRTDLARPEGFQPGRFFSADFEMIMRLYSAGRTFRYIPGTIAVFDTRGQSNRQMARSARSNRAVLGFYHPLAPNEKWFYRRFIFRAMLTEWIYMVIPSSVLGPFLKWVYRDHLINWYSKND